MTISRHAFKGRWRAAKRARARRPARTSPPPVTCANLIRAWKDGWNRA